MRAGVYQPRPGEVGPSDRYRGATGIVAVFPSCWSYSSRIPTFEWIEKMIRKTLLAALSVLVCCGALTVRGAEPGKLPGRSIEMKRLPDTVRRFVVRHFTNLHQFTYRSDRRFYYVCDEMGGYYLFSAAGAIQGFRFCMRQPSHEIVELLPGAATAYIRGHYRNYFLGAFLPDGDGFRAELFGADDRTLLFDAEGRFLSGE